MTNTKLTEDQRAARKRMLGLYGRDFGYSGRLTVFRHQVFPHQVFPHSRMATFSVAYAAPDEIKVRRKVGEYYALCRAWDDEGIQLPACIGAQDLADMLAEMEDESDYSLGLSDPKPWPVGRDDYPE